MSFQVERALTLWRDNHLEYRNSVLSVKETEPVKPGQKGETSTSKMTAYDFSRTNWEQGTVGWLKGIQKKYDQIFPGVCDEAHTIAGVKGRVDSDSEADSDSAGGRAAIDSDDTDEDHGKSHL